MMTAMNESFWINGQSALFLDFDGTLADLAETPEAVRVEPGLVDTLEVLRQRLGGALAIVTGRPMIQTDGFLAPLLLPTAGIHGAERRGASGIITQAPELEMPLIEAAVDQLLRRYPALRAEKKRSAIALHYRQAPELRWACVSALQEAVSHYPEATLLEGKMVVEVKSRSTTKATAIRDFLLEAPFHGRQPVFAGDDVTDEAGFEYVQSVNGLGVKVGPGETIAWRRVDSPAWLRESLRLAAQNLPA